ncbi:DUF192 domain-containing protein [Lignipirellula cremea]|uniref:ACR n=1 Tax=Lignipirellula cremea TaxID=2528010 RepID=A0A518E422_9BACT|nr:DUF192 domain-containing protein [Lignipirellula cremea]QDU98845.1 hypothetical protein Pla8534_67560 [Lignipirellula cremea]
MTGPHQMIDADTGAVLVPRLQLATTFWQRFRGLQFRQALAADEGLLIIPCSSLHTHWMRFAIDVVMLDQGDNVLKLHENLRPWRILTAAPGTHSVLEVTTGCLRNFHPGQRVSVVDKETKQPGPHFPAKP